MRPKGMPPDHQPVQRVLDWLIKYSPSACSPKATARALRMQEPVVAMSMAWLADGKFVVQDGFCFRAAGEEDGGSL